MAETIVYFQIPPKTVAQKFQNWENKYRPLPKIQLLFDEKD